MKKQSRVARAIRSKGWIVAAFFLACGASDNTGLSIVHPADSDSLTFVVLGDAGTGYDSQYAVGRAVATVCDQRQQEGKPCSFALYLGDNIYDSGVTSTDDPRLQSRFEEPYRDLDFPFYVVSGNHDYGWRGAGSPALYDETRLSYQLAYSQLSEKWTFPSRYYSFRTQDDGAVFLGLDSTSLLWRDDRPQHEWISEKMAALPQDAWVFSYKHHTVLSNGKHGNAGSYPVIEGADGSALRDIYRDELCGKVHVIFTGHDHNLQWHEDPCGTHVIVSGAAGKGSKLRDPDNRPNPNPRFEIGPGEGGRDEVFGFVLVELQGDQLTGIVYDQNAEELYRHSFSK